MKKASALLLTFLLLFAFASCHGHIDPEPEQTLTDAIQAAGNESVSEDTVIDLIADYFSETVDGLEISVSTPDVVCPGTAFKVIATVTNNTGEPLEYTYGCCSDTDPGHFGVVAEIGDGERNFINVSELTRYFCDGLTVRTLENGESIREEIQFFPAWSMADKELLANIFTSSLTPVWNMPCIPYDVEEQTNENGETVMPDYIYYNFETGYYSGNASFTAGTQGGYSRSVSVDFSVCVEDICLYEEVTGQSDTAVCSEPTAPANFGFLKPVQYTASKDGLVLEVFAPAKVPRGQDFTVSAIITNTTDEPITYTLPSCTPDMHLEIEVDIKAENGKHFIDLDTAGKCMAEAMLQKTLAPGESFQEVIRFTPSWSDDVSAGLEFATLTEFEEGNYYGTAEFRWDGENTGEENALSLEFPVKIIPMPN